MKVDAKSRVRDQNERQEYGANIITMHKSMILLHKERGVDLDNNIGQ